MIAGWPASAAAAPAALTLHASRTAIKSSSAVRLSGKTTPGLKVNLFASAFPTHGRALIASTTAGPNGGFSFRERPQLDTTYVARVNGGHAARIEVDVSARAIRKVRAISLGRARITLVLFHPAALHWSGAIVRWSLAAAGAAGFQSAPPTRARRLGRYVTVLRTTIALPAGPYRWRACFNAPGVHALLNLPRPAGCKGRGYHGHGSLPVGFPGPTAVARAARYLATRTGTTAFAVVDSEGRLSGVNVHRTFVSASVTKAMLLVAYLRRLAAKGRTHVDPYSNSFLYPMIHLSDNDAATKCYSIVGDAGLDEVARLAGMTEFAPNGFWAIAQISAADQARFFLQMDSLIPARFVGYARTLLSTIVSYESWGIPALARGRGYSVFFKGGWRPHSPGYLVHQIARLEGHGRRFAIAVMTDHDPDMSYGIDTIQGVIGALL